MKDDVNVNDEVEATEEGSDAVEAAGLGVNDLASIKHIIDVASARGAFKAEEFAVVGSVYGRLNAFLNAVVASAQDNLAETEEGTEETTEGDADVGVED